MRLIGCRAAFLQAGVDGEVAWSCECKRGISSEEKQRELDLSKGVTCVDHGDNHEHGDDDRDCRDARCESDKHECCAEYFGTDGEREAGG